MAEYFPQAVVLIADLIATDGFLLQPPLAWTATAEQINAESSSTIAGRYIESTGEAAGQPGTAQGILNDVEQVVDSTAASTVDKATK